MTNRIAPFHYDTCRTCGFAVVVTEQGRQPCIKCEYAREKESTQVSCTELRTWVNALIVALDGVELPDLVKMLLRGRPTI